MIEEEIRDADEIEFITNHPRYKAAWDAVEKAIYETFVEANSHDQATKDECHRSIKNLRRLHEVFDLALQRGYVARESLKRTALQRAREVIGL